MKLEHVAVRVFEERLVANARIDDLAHELDAKRLEFGASSGDIVDAECDRVLVGPELDPRTPRTPSP
jgi:hypothetical protein